MAPKPSRVGRTGLLLPSERATAVVTERQGQYGSPLVVYGPCATFWNAWLSIEGTDEVIRPIDPLDVAMMQALLKIARQRSKPFPDNITDLAGYANVYEMIEKEL